MNILRIVMKTEQIKDLIKTSFGGKVISSAFRYRHEAYLQGFILDRPYYVRGNNDKKLIMTIPLIMVKERKAAIETEEWLIDTNNIRFLRKICDINCPMFVNLTCNIKFNEENKIKLTLTDLQVIKTFPNLKLDGLELNNELIKRLRLKVNDNE